MAKRCRCNEETTLVAGTEMKKSDVAYIVPIAMIVLSLLFFIVEKFFTGFVLIGIAALLMIVIGLRSKKIKVKM